MRYAAALICLSCLLLGQQPSQDAVTATDLSGTVQTVPKTQSSPPVTEAKPASPEPEHATPAPSAEQPRVEKTPQPVAPEKTSAPKTSGKRVAAFWIILPEK